VPEWYFLPFYAILRAIPNKVLGVVAMLSSILILLALPWFTRLRLSMASPVLKFAFWIFVANFFILMWLGAQPIHSPYVELGQFCTVIYFGYFVMLMVVG
jgi:ubiquinol-cytochrome c reductase cytochrome b subunit